MTCALYGNDEVSGRRPTRRPVAPRWVYLLVAVATISNACSQAPAPPPYVRVDPTLSTPQEVDSNGSDDADDVEQGPPPEPPTYLSGGFVDLTPNALDMALHSGDIATLDFPEISQGVFADIDQDGQLEVILSAEFEIGQNPNQVLSYDVDSQTLVARPDLSLPTGSIVIAEDLDNDGMTDLLVASGAEPPLHWGLGGGQLAIGTPLSGIELPYREVTTLWLTDVDADGWLDIVAGSNCALIPLLRTRTRSFLARDDLLQGFGVADAYAVMAAPVRAGEMALFSLGHVDCGNLGETLLTPFELNSFGYPLFEPIALHGPDVHFASELAPGMQTLGFASPMGITVADFDGDTLFDLAITLDPTHGVFRGRVDWPFEDVSDQTFMVRQPADSGVDMLGWGVAALDLDRDGLDDLVTVHGDDLSTFSDPSRYVGPAHTTAYWNAGDFKFADITDSVGLGLRGNWRSLAVGDLEGDGDPDLIVGGVGRVPRVYRNDIESPLSGFAIRLEGTVSNHLGVGATIRVEAREGGPVRHYLMGHVSSTKAGSQALVFPGIGGETRAHRVIVSWPSGVESEHLQLEAGTVHTLVEPSWLQIEPLTRHVPADGVSTARFTIKPETVASSVELRVSHGVQVTIASTSDDDGWRFDLKAPQNPGSSRIEVLIDGVVMGVAPRIWWDASGL